MEQTNIVSSLVGSMPGNRISTLNYLEETLSNEENLASFEISPATIKALTIAFLETEVGSTKCRCLYLLQKILPSLKDNISQSFAGTAPIVLGYFIYPSEPIRLLARSLWMEYVKLSSDRQLVIDHLVTYGLQSSSHLLRNTIALDLISLMPQNLEQHADLNYHGLVQCFVNLLIIKNIKFSLKRRFFKTYDLLKERIGVCKFDNILSTISTKSDSKEFFGMGCEFTEWRNSFDIEQYKGIFPQKLIYGLIHYESYSSHKTKIRKLKNFILKEMKEQTLEKHLKSLFELLLYLFVQRPSIPPSVASDIFKLLTCLIQVGGEKVSDSMYTIVACVASWIDVNPTHLQFSILQTCLALTKATSDNDLIAVVSKYLQPDQPSQRRTSFLKLIIFLHLNNPTAHYISADAEKCADEHTTGFRGKTMRLVISCLISDSPELKLASLECLAVFLNEIKTADNRFYLKKVFFSTIANQLEFLMGERVSKDDKSLVYMAISMRLSRNKLACINTHDFSIK